MITTNKKGFTLIEVLTVVFVVGVGMVSALTLIQTSVSSSRFASSQLTATYLTQEGVELVREVRDSNYLKRVDGQNVNWDGNLSEGTYQMDYDDVNKTNPLGSWTGGELKLSSEGYTHGSGTSTRYRRKIEILDKEDSNGDGTPDKIEIKVTTFFNFKGEQYKVEARENLYHWWQ